MQWEYHDDFLLAAQYHSAHTDATADLTDTDWDGTNWCTIY